MGSGHNDEVRDEAGRPSSSRSVVLVAVATFLGAAIVLSSCNSGSAATGPGDDIVSIAVSVGNPPLNGTLTLPAHKGPFPAVVLVSGSGPNDQDETVGADKPFLDIADGLATLGIASIRYDKRTRDYPGSIDLATFTPTQEYVPDAVAAIHLLKRRSDIDTSRIFVLGHSQGGTFAPKIAEAVLKSLVSSSSPRRQNPSAKPWFGN